MSLDEFIDALEAFRLEHGDVYVEDGEGCLVSRVVFNEDSRTVEVIA